MKNLIYIISLIFLFVSCQKTIDCISNVGEEVVYTYSLSDFDTLIVNNEFEINLVQDTVNMMIISAYEKYAESVSYKTENRCLILDNTYRCNFTKPEKNKVKAEIHVKEISLIRLNSPSELISENTLINDDEIGVIVNPKFFEAELKVDCRVFYFWNTHLNGGKMYLHGKSEFLKLWNTSLFSVDAADLETDNVFVKTDSKGDVSITATKELNCTIEGSGNVYYVGNPEKIIVNDTLSSGKLIKLQ